MKMPTDHPVPEERGAGLRCSIVGCGHMGFAIARGMHEGRPSISLVAIDTDMARRAHAENFGIDCTAELATSPGDLIVLAIPPQRFAAFAARERSQLRRARLVISVMAGITVAQIVHACGNTRVVRAIPNTPAEIGESMTVFIVGADLPEADRHIARAILSAFGRICEIGQESLIDDATALCGGGPAFFALIGDAFRVFAVTRGFSEVAAQDLVSQILTGTGRLLEATRKSPMQICREVMTPNGTTERGIAALQQAGIESLVVGALSAAAARSRVLSHLIADSAATA